MLTLSVWMTIPALVFAVDTPSTQLPVAVKHVLDKRGLPESSLGVFVQDVTNHQPILLFNGATAFNPGSTMKLITTFVAMDVLSPVYRWRTQAYVNAPVVDGVLTGDLFIKGDGDPFLTTEYFWKFLRGIRSRGIRHVAGNLILDKSAFLVAPEDPSTFDGKPYRAYNVAPDPLLLNFQVTDFLIRPNAHKGIVEVIADPPQANLRIENNLTLVPGNCNGYPYRINMRVLDQLAGTRVRFAGKYSAKCGEYPLTRAVSRSNDYFLGVFKAVWDELGGSFEGGVQVAPVPANARLFHSMYSRPVADLIRGMNKYSNNVMTRQLLLTLGMQRYGAPGTVEKGRKAVEEWFARNGIETDGLILDNGAGLSRQARISAQTLGGFLLSAYRSPLMAEFVSSLPLAAMDGSLQRRFRGEPLGGRLHIKTGLLDDVRGLGGYMLTASGRTFVVVTLQNYRGIHRGAGTAVQNALLRWLFEQ